MGDGVADPVERQPPETGALGKFLSQNEKFEPAVFMLVQCTPLLVERGVQIGVTGNHWPLRMDSGTTI